MSPLDIPTAIGLGVLLLAVLGTAGRLCFLMKRLYNQHQELLEKLGKGDES